MVDVEKQVSARIRHLLKYRAPQVHAFCFGYLTALNEQNILSLQATDRIKAIVWNHKKIYRGKQDGKNR